MRLARGTTPRAPSLYRRARRTGPTPRGSARAAGPGYQRSGRSVRSPRPRRWSRPLASVLLGLLLLAAAPGSNALVLVRRAGLQPARHPQPALKPGPIMLPESPDIDHLFKRARQAADRKDWKVAVDALQCIIEEPGHAWGAPKDNVFESARRQAHRQLASLPADALATYRLIYDGQAKALLERAQTDHDAPLLGELVSKYLISSYGDDASDLLASWELDANHPGAAAILIRDVLDIYPDSDLPSWHLLGKLAVAYRLMGCKPDAISVLKRLPAAPAQPETAWRVDGIVQFVNSDAAVNRPAEAPAAWPMLLGGPKRTGRAADVNPVLLEDLPWRYDMAGAARLDKAKLAELQKQSGSLPASYAVTDGVRIFVRAPGRVVAFDAETFDLLWAAKTTDGPVAQGAQPRADTGTVPAEVVRQLGLEGDAAVIKLGPQGDQAGHVGELIQEIMRGGDLGVAPGALPIQPRRPEELIQEIITKLDAGAAPGALPIQAPRAEDVIEEIVTRLDPVAPGARAIEARRAAERVQEVMRGRDLRAAPAGARRIRKYFVSPPEPTPSQPALLDDVTGSLAIAHGLVFAIERNPGAFGAVGVNAGLPEVGADVMVIIKGGAPIVPLRQPQPVSGASPASRLIAIDPGAKGAILWTQGSTGKQDDPLAGWEILAPPMEAGPHLLVVYRKGPRLYASLLDPRDGGLVKQLELCTVDPASFNELSALFCAIADGVAYVPTGQGFLMALELPELAPRWASRYGRSLPKARANQSLANWSSTPPIVAGPVVVLAPHDSNQLLVFDRASGALAWSVPRQGHRYVLGAEGGLVWIAGSAVTALNVHTGDQVWSTSLATATGRGALSGDRVFVPTTEGLAVLDASTGELLGQSAVPEGHQPLGNLLCWRDALYSVDATEVRKFPDLDKSYHQTLRQHEQDPRDAAIAIRLAWLELFRENPRGVLSALAELELGSDGLDARRTKVVAQLKLEALVALAHATAKGSAEGIELLRRASRVAIKPEDKIRLQLELGSWLTTAGQLAAAYREYLEVALTELGDEPIDREADLYQRSGPRAAQALAGLGPMLGASARQELVAELNQRLAQAVGTADHVLARRLAEAQLVGGVSEAADIQLARWALAEDRLMFAQAEYHLRRAGAAREDPRRTAEALAWLARMYLMPEQNMPAQAARCLSRLEQDFANVLLPAEITGGQGGTPVRAADLASRLRRWIDASGLSYHQDVLAGRVRSAPARQVWRLRQPACRPVHIRAGCPEALAETALVLIGGDRLQAHRLSDGELLWAADLRLLRQGPLSAGSPEGSRKASSAGTFGRSAASDGQTLVITTAHGLHAVGLATGRRLWSRPFERSLPGAPPTSDHWISAQNGRLAMIPQAGVVEVVRLADGRTTWRRHAGPFEPAAIRTAGELVFAVDQRLEHVLVCRLEDGEELATIELNQPEDRVSLAVFPEAACGPDGSAIVGYDPRSGAELWRTANEAPLSAVFKPRPDVLGLGRRDGTVQLINPKSGESIFQARLAGREQGVIDASIRGELLCVMAVGAADPKDQVMKLTAVRMSDGQTVWQRDQLHLVAARSAARALDLLRLAADMIPLLEIVPGDGRPALQVPERGSGRVEHVAKLTLIDAETGKQLGEPLGLEVDGLVSGDLAIWPDRVVVATNEGVTAFGPARRVAGDQQG